MGVDMAAGQLHRGFGAALEGNVDEFHLRRLVDHAGEGFIGVLGLRAAHLEIAGRLRGDGFEKILHVLVGRILLDPEQELVLHHRGNRRQVRVIIGDLGDHRLVPGIRCAEHDLVGIARHGLGVGVAFGAAAAGLVDDDDRLLDEFVFGDDVLDRAGKIIRAAARACRCNEFDRFGRLPGGIGRSREPNCKPEGDCSEFRF